MSPPIQADQPNLLLRRMAARDFALLAPHLQPFHGTRGLQVWRANEPAPYAVFPSSGIVSVIATSPGGQRVEAGLFGHEGFGPLALVAGDGRASLEGVVQLPGAGCRIAADPFRAALEASAELGLLLQRFAQVLTLQVAFTALSNAVHSVEERLARWILMCDDRAGSGELAMTHEFMAMMLAVRRPSVTTALHVLEGHGLISAARGLVTIRNRAALEGFAADAYGGPEREYDRLLGAFR